MSFADPAAAEEAFYTAFETLELELMGRVWAESPQTSCIHPGGDLLRGTESVLASWADIFRDSAPPRISHQLIHASTDRHLAVHTVREDIRTGASGRRAVVLATNVYQRADDGWRLLAHHASLPLVDARDPVPESHPLH